jgi:hypothetical protein
MKKFACAALAAAMVLGAGSAASAATIVKKFDFMASTFTPSGAPVNPVIGSITIEFDPTVTVSQSTSGITLNSLNIALGSPLMFSFNPGFFGLMSIGGTQGSDGVQHGTNDFAFSFFNADTATPQTPLFFYSQVGHANAYETRNVALSVSVVPPSGGVVPEPAAWALMIGGFGLAGSALRRRKSVAVGTVLAA